jgi:hypothetical protein
MAKMTPSILYPDNRAGKFQRFLEALSGTDFSHRCDQLAMAVSKGVITPIT